MSDRLRNRKSVLADRNDGQLSNNSSNGERSNNINHLSRTFHVQQQKFTRVTMLLTIILCIVLLAGVLVHRYPTTGASSSTSFRLNQHPDRKATAIAPSNRIYDVAVLGAGPAGLTAAMFVARSGLSVVLFGSQSGLLSETPRLDNFPGYDLGRENTGIEWLQTTRKQAQEVGTQFAPPGLLVKSIRPTTNDTFSLTAQLGTTYHSLSVIVATGATPRRLRLAMEDDLWGVSIHNCAICDGSLYDDKTVLIVGGGDAALDAAVYLSRRAKRVVLVHRRKQFTAKQSMQRLLEIDNIEIRTPYLVTKWETNAQEELTGARIMGTANDDSTIVLPCDGVFLMIGATPNTEWIGDTLELDNEGLIRLQNSNALATRQTSLPGVFAAGEVTDNRYRQAITAAAEGAQAALDAQRWLSKMRQTANTNDSDRIIPSSKRKDASDQRQARGEMVAPLSKRGGGVQLHSQSKENHDDDCDFGKEGCMVKVIKQYPLVVFSSHTCPYCVKLLELLTLVGVKEPHVVELGYHRDIPGDIRDQLTLQAGSRSVPSLFIGGVSIGGYTDAKKMHTLGELSVKLKNAGVITETSLQENYDDNCDFGKEECMEKVVKQYPLVVFSSYTCPECHRLLELLTLIGVKEPHIIELGAHYNIPGDIRDQLTLQAGTQSVPSLFIGGESMRGYTNTKKMHNSGELSVKLKKAGVIIIKR